MKPDEKTVKLFENDRFATENGAVIEEVEEHYAKCSLKLGSRHRNAMGAVMGGVYFTLADFAFAVAANWQGTEQCHFIQISHILEVRRAISLLLKLSVSKMAAPPVTTKSR